MSELPERGVLPPQTHHFASSGAPPRPTRQALTWRLDQLCGVLAALLLLNNSGNSVAAGG